jgi:hypothetical protein
MTLHALEPRSEKAAKAISDHFSPFSTIFSIFSGVGNGAPQRM